MSCLPPTLNELAPSQRARLVRSTRKLQAVLGATPQLVEPPQSAHRNTKKLALTLAPNPHHPTRPLLLTLSSSSYLHIASPTTRSRSNSLAERPPLSPLTPTTSRRKRMAKLTRTLGENIPPELVSKSRRTLPERKSIPDFDAKGEESDDTLCDVLAPVKEAETHPLTPTASLPMPSPQSNPAIPLRAVSVCGPRSQHKHTTGWGHRREKGWSGEWNADRDEILRRLRGLKV